MRTGRPIDPVPQDKANEIISWIEEGKTLREWCRLPGNPSHQTVYNWIEKDKDFALRFAHARESGEDVIAQECLQIADETPMMTITFGESGVKECIDNAGIQRNRLRVDTRLKLLAKWNPKKYGEKSQVDMNVSGELKLAERLAAARKRK
jgi:hypothetical protein